MYHVRRKDGIDWTLAARVQHAIATEISQRITEFSAEINARWHDLVAHGDPPETDTVYRNMLLDLDNLRRDRQTFEEQAFLAEQLSEIGESYGAGADALTRYVPAAALELADHLLLMLQELSLTPADSVTNGGAFSRRALAGIAGEELLPALAKMIAREQQQTPAFSTGADEGNPTATELH